MTPREELREAMAFAAYRLSYGTATREDWARAPTSARRLRYEIADSQLATIEAHDGGCWIAPNNLTGAMSERAALQLTLKTSGFALNRARTKTRAIYRAFKFEMPYAPPAKDPT